jgi:hypothetical protein
MQLCHELNDGEGEHLNQALLARIAEDRFNLAVLGAFKRGKMHYWWLNFQGEQDRSLLQLRFCPNLCPRSFPAPHYNL